MSAMNGRIAAFTYRVAHLVYVNGMGRLVRQPEQHGDDEEGGGGHTEADAAQGVVRQFAQLAHGAPPDGGGDANQRAFAEEHQRERQPPGGHVHGFVSGVVGKGMVRKFP